MKLTYITKFMYVFINVYNGFWEDATVYFNINVIECFDNGFMLF